jgi:hypothetical protein
VEKEESVTTVRWRKARESERDRRGRGGTSESSGGTVIAFNPKFKVFSALNLILSCSEKREM